MDAHVAVVGTGILGLATATQLLQAGTDVVLITAGLPGQSTHVSDHRLVHVDPAYIRPARHALRGWAEWERQWGTACIAPVGLVHAGAGAPERAQQLVDAGRDVQPLTGHEARHRTFGQPSRSAFLEPAAGVLDVHRAVTLLSSTLTLHTVNATVQRIEHDGEHARMHMTAGAPVTVQRVIVCAGPGGHAIAEASGVQLPGSWRRRARCLYAVAGDSEPRSAWTEPGFSVLPIPEVGALVDVDDAPAHAGGEDAEIIERASELTRAIVQARMPDLDARAPLAVQLYTSLDAPDLVHGAVGYEDGPVLWMTARNAAPMAPVIGAELATWARTGATAGALRVQRQA